MANGTPRPASVEARGSNRIWVAFSDGTQGEVDLSDTVGVGVFEPLADAGFFATVHVGEFGQIAWSSELEICSDAIYRELSAARNAEALHA